VHVGTLNEKFKRLSPGNRTNMTIWIVLLVIFSFLSLLIDMQYLPPTIFRHIWNVLMLALGLYLFARISMKMMQGSFECLQKEYEDLNTQIEEKQHGTLVQQIDELKDRIARLEAKQ